MPVIKIHQTLLDVATQSAGSAEALVQLAFINGFGITDEVTPGTQLTATTVLNERVTDYYNIPGNGIATGWQAAVFMPGEGLIITLATQNVTGLRSLQTMLDAALFITGSAEQAVALAALNGLSLTDSFTDGQQLQKLPVVVKEVVKEFTTYQPATGISATDADLEGIGYWTIGLDFIVS